MVSVVFQLFEFSQKTTLAAMATSLQELLATGNPDSTILAEAVDLVDTTKEYVLSVIIGLSVLLGFIAAQISLKPVRESLLMQKRFISSAAHELRTPLAVLRIENEVAAIGSDVASVPKETLIHNIEEIDKMTEILNNLLLFNKVDSIERNTFQDVNLAELVRAAEKRLRKLAESKGVSLLVDSTNPPFIYGNATALEQAIFNIIKNAILYTPVGGEVNVTYSAISDGFVTLTIRDNGVGIPKQELPHIFEPFYRSKQNTKEQKGTGIGLAIVFEIVKLHNGKIQVESKVGEGTAFHITLTRFPHLKPKLNTGPASGVTYDFTSIGVRADS